jgi:hypothetical protein
MYKIHKTITISPQIESDLVKILKADGSNFSAWVEQMGQQFIAENKHKASLKKRIKIKLEYPEEYFDNSIPITDPYDYNSYPIAEATANKTGIRAPRSIRTQF